MALPLPRVISDVGPGGGLVTSMGGINSLANDMLLRKINSVKAQYAPLTTQADAASKLAYANLMGPQFIAKLMGNEAFLGNTKDEKLQQLREMVTNAGMGQGSGANVFSQMQQSGAGTGERAGNSLSNFFANKLRGVFGGQAQSNPLAQSQAMEMGNEMPAPQSDSQMGALKRPENGVRVEGEQWYDKNGNPVYDEEVQQPGEPTMNLEITKGQRAPQKTYAENTGTFKGTLEEGKELGKIRAKDIEKLNNAVFNAETNQATLDKISDILASPTFEKIRQVPLAGHHELSYYAREGTPDEQQMVGSYYTLTGNLIKDASRDFAGQFRKGEQQLLNGMKPSPSDTVNSAKGKTETLSVLNRMLSARSRLTSKIMAENHVNKLEAMEIADKQINGEQIRREVHDRLNPKITIRNRKTGETKTISAEEARKLGVPNV